MIVTSYKAALREGGERHFIYVGLFRRQQPPNGQDVLWTHCAQ